MKLKIKLGHETRTIEHAKVVAIESDDNDDGLSSSLNVKVDSHSDGTMSLIIEEEIDGS